MRIPLIVGNWKLNGNRKMLKEFFFEIKNKINIKKNCEIVIAPPIIYLYEASTFIKKNNIPVFLAAQNVDFNTSGSFTGEVSINMLKEIGVKYVIIGHSERRKYHHESNETIAKKFFIIKSSGLIPILCIGEKKYENDLNNAKKVCIEQLDYIVNYFSSSDNNIFQNSVIAYEPIWAIGSGIPACSDKVQKIHKFIRNYVLLKTKKIKNNTIIQYGGSVNENNAKEFLKKSDIDGVLLGNSSLNIKSFCKIIQIAIKNKLSNNAL